jgi:hypothetical protein
VGGIDEDPINSPIRMPTKIIIPHSKISNLVSLIYISFVIYNIANYMAVVNGIPGLF